MKTTIQKTPAQISAEEIDQSIVRLSESPPVFVKRAMTALLTAEDPQAVLDVWGPRAALLLNALVEFSQAAAALAAALGEESPIAPLPEGLLVPNADGTVKYNPLPEPLPEEAEEQPEEN